MEKIPVIILLGPTASGKTDIAIELALRLGGEILSVDSMQVYKNMNIGTGKPSIEEQKGVPHHLIDLCESTESFSVGMYLERADLLASQIHSRGKKVFLVGGTPLYVKRFIEGISEGPAADPGFRQKMEDVRKKHGVLYLHHLLAQVDPESCLRIHPMDQRRLVRALEVYSLTGIPMSQGHEHEGKTRSQYEFKIFGLKWPREILYERIEKRIDRMLEKGWIQEVEKLREKGLSQEASQALGYREILKALEKNLSMDQAIYEIKRNTRHFARRQILWFGQFPDVDWVEMEKYSSENLIEYFLKEISCFFEKNL